MMFFSICVLFAIGTYTVLSIHFYQNQSSHVFRPSQDILCDPSSVNIEYEDVSIKTDDGETLNAWYIPSAVDSETSPVILFSHGNAGNVGDRVACIKALHDMAFSIIIYDYRGYGRSTGVPSEEGTYRDSMAVWNYLLKDKKVDPSRIILLGHSLGGAITSQLAENVSPAGVVLESTFTSTRKMARRMFPLLPSGLLCAYGYNSEERVFNIRVPVLIAHSTEDTMIPYSHGESIFAAANEPKMLVTMKCGHNEGIDVDPEYQKSMVKFVGDAISRA